MSVRLRTDALGVGYNGTPVVSGIDVDLDPGTVLTLIGPNGAGKSTILKTIAKYLAAITGTVYIDRTAVASMSNRSLARQVAVVLTDRLKTELMTCYDVVATGRYPHTGRFGILGEEDKNKVREAMELLHAWELRDRDFRQISDGQKQRILIARALCQEPQIIVLDEPTAYLDVRYKLELLSILRHMAKDRGISVIMSLHELDMAQKISDMVMCVDETITQYGPPSEIFIDDRIDVIFGLTHGTYDPLFGNLEFGPSEGEAKVFVVAGDGSGIPAYRSLHAQGIPFVTGILHRNDVDYHIGARLASEVFSESAFEPISDAVFDSAMKRLSSCRTVVTSLGEYGTLNSRNAILIDCARDMGLAIVGTAEEVRR